MPIMPWAFNFVVLLYPSQHFLGLIIPLLSLLTNMLNFEDQSPVSKLYELVDWVITVAKIPVNFDKGGRFDQFNDSFILWAFSIEFHFFSIRISPWSYFDLQRVVFNILML